MEQLSLISVWWVKNANMQVYSDKTQRTHSRIDAILISKDLREDIKLASIGLRVYSVHASVTIVWEVNKKFWKTYQWHLNNLLLESSGLKEKITSEMEAFFSQNGDSTEETVVWDTIKVYISGILIAFKAYRDKIHMSSQVY